MAGNKMFTGWFITIFIVYLWMYTQFSKVKVLKILVMSKVNKYSRNRAIYYIFIYEILKYLILGLPEHLVCISIFPLFEICLMSSSSFLNSYKVN